MLTLASFTSLANRSVSSLICLAICTRESPMGCAPISSIFLRNSAELMIFTTSVFNFVRISVGVAAGANRPNQVPKLKPFRPASSNVGTSGKAPERFWTSLSSAATYPVQWDLRIRLKGHDEPIWQSLRIKALVDNQELDSRQSTGAIYWEGLSDLLDEQGQVIGRGYLEMTGYASPLKL